MTDLACVKWDRGVRKGRSPRPWRVRGLAGCLLCFALVILPWSGWAAGPQGHVITLVTEEMRPFNYTQDGSLYGFSADLVRAALDAAGLAYTIDVLPWPRALDRALKDRNVFIFSMARTPQRESNFIWVHALAPAQVRLFRLASRADLAQVDRRELSSFRTATIREYFTSEILAQWGVPDRKSVFFGDERKSAVLEHLELGRSDFFLGDPLIFAHEIKTAGMEGRIVPHGEAIRVGDYYLAANAGTDLELVEQVRAAVAGVFERGEAEALRDRYLKIPAP